MAVTVTNVSRMVLLIRLRSGGSLHLRPGERTGELADAEVRHNPRVDTLVERSLVHIDDVPAETAGSVEDAPTAEDVQETAAADEAGATKPRRQRAGAKASGEGASG
jgi:hypothetical protein